MLNAAKTSVCILETEGSIIWALLHEFNQNLPSKLVSVTQLMFAFQTLTVTMDWRELSSCLEDFEHSLYFLNYPCRNLAFDLKCIQKNCFNIHFSVQKSWMNTLSPILKMFSWLAHSCSCGFSMHRYNPQIFPSSYSPKLNLYMGCLETTLGQG